MKKIRVHLKDRSYDILIGRGLLNKSGAIIKRLDIGKDAICITNTRLFNLYGGDLGKSLKKAGYSVRFINVPDSEKAKTEHVAASVIEKISTYDTRRKIFIINLGGGVIGDLGGFVASVYKRGIPYVHIPTTLLAQVDSAIGGKVAIDLATAKNLIGSFYQPRAVISDAKVIDSLPKREVVSGLAEVVKYGVIKDRTLFMYLENNYEKIMRRNNRALEHIIYASSRIKAAVVEADEFDRTGRRAILNFGHTIGHAIETASDYSGRYNHGEAIAVGMAASCAIARRLKLIGAEEAERIIDLIQRIGLPVRARGVRLGGVYEAHLHDKKFIHGKNRFILPVRIGRVRIVEDIPEEVIREVLKEEIL